MEKTLKVTGKGNIKLKPDLTIINITLSGIEKEYDAVINKATLDAKSLKNNLNRLEMALDDIKTVNFNINPEYESYRDEQGNYSSRFIGYKYQQLLKLEFDISNEKLGKILYAITLAKVDPRLEIIYTIKDKECAKNLLLKKAIDDAKIKAKIIADASEVRLGEIISIDYNFSDNEISSRVMECKSVQLRNAPFDSPYEMNIVPEDLKISDFVTVIYSIN